MITPDDLIMSLNSGNSTMGDWLIIEKFSHHRSLKVELGTGNGLTSILLSKNGGQTWTIDRDNDVPTINYLFAEYGIHAVLDDTVKAAELSKDKEIDLLFIDGGHEYKQVKADYQAWYPKVKTDSVILFHDMDPGHPGVFRFYNKDIQKELSSGRLKELEQATSFETSIKVFVKCGS